MSRFFQPLGSEDGGYCIEHISKLRYEVIMETHTM